MSQRVSVTRLVVHEVKTNILHSNVRRTTVFQYSLQFSIVIEIMSVT